MFNITRDYAGVQATYEATAVIQHQGTTTRDGDGEGHYICDVKWKDSEYVGWFRANDNLCPVP